MISEDKFNNLQINQQLNQQQKDNLNKIDETIEKIRKIELDKKLEKELQDKNKKLEEDRKKNEPEGMSLSGRE